MMDYTVKQAAMRQVTHLDASGRLDQLLKPGLPQGIDAGTATVVQNVEKKAMTDGSQGGDGFDSWSGVANVQGTGGVVLTVAKAVNDDYGSGIPASELWVFAEGKMIGSATYDGANYKTTVVGDLPVRT